MNEPIFSSSLEEVTDVLAAEFGVTPADINRIVDCVDEARGTMGPADLQQGLQALIVTYIDALEVAASQFTEAGDRATAERLVDLVLATLAGQMEAATIGVN